MLYRIHMQLWARYGHSCTDAIQYRRDGLCGIARPRVRGSQSALRSSDKSPSSACWRVAKKSLRANTSSRSRVRGRASLAP